MQLLSLEFSALPEQSQATEREEKHVIWASQLLHYGYLPLQGCGRSMVDKVDGERLVIIHDRVNSGFVNFLQDFIGQQIKSVRLDFSKSITDLLLYLEILIPDQDAPLAQRDGQYEPFYRQTYWLLVMENLPSSEKLHLMWRCLREKREASMEDKKFVCLALFGPGDLEEYKGLSGFCFRPIAIQRESAPESYGLDGCCSLGMIGRRSAMSENRTSL